MKIKLTALCFLFVIATAFVQTDADFIQTLTKKLQQFKLQKPQVKVFMFFNQSMYAPGDTAYFSTHFLSEDFEPIGGRQILRVDLIDQSGKLVFFENIALKDGKGSNQVAIPAELQAGIYQWVAYSDWMKNFSSDFYFRQDFLLVEKNSLVADKKNDQVEIKFYPEGGTLISSVLNNVALASNSDITSPIRIVDQVGNEVTKVQLSDDGLAQFNFTPSATHTYYAEVEHLGKLVRVNLPTASAGGFAIMMSPSQDPMKVEIRAPRDSKSRKEDLWLVVTARSEVYFSAPVRFDERDLITVQFPSKELPTGICYATLFDEQGEVLAERLFMSNSIPEVRTTIVKNQKVYNTRSNVELQVSLKDPLGNPIQGEFAISIFSQKLFGSQRANAQMDRYLYVNSEVTGKRHYSPDELDLFLITQKNKRLDWKTIKAGNTEAPHSFKRLIQYSGRALNKENGQPVPDSSRVVAYLQKSMMGYEATTRKDGSFDLAFLFDFWNDDEIFYTVETRRGKELDAKVEWAIDSFSRSQLSPMIETETANSYADFASRKKLLDRSYNFYSKSEAIVQTSLPDDPNRDFEDELTGVDYTVKVDEYVVFPSMEELIREVVPSLLHRKLKGKAIVRVVLPDGAIPNEGPLFIIDGIMTKNTDYFLQLKPADVISVKVVRTISKLNRFGTMGRNGIVLVHTKGIDHKKLKSENTLISVKGLNKAIPFHVPSHSASTDQRVPDFRSTLYWNPSVITNARGEGVISFSASDDAGNFLIRVQGITSDGRPFSQLDSLQVVFN
jgi:hypothetical protein